MRRLGFGFKNALRGIAYAIVNERNFRVHIVAMLSVVYFAAVFGIQKWQWAAIIFVVALVMAAELINTAFEKIVDELSPQRSDFARIVKDCGAAAVLVLAVGAVALAVVLFWDAQGWQRIWEYIKDNYCWLIAFVILGTGFIYIKKENKR